MREMITGYGGTTKEQTIVDVRLSTQNKLERRKRELESELKAVNEAIMLFTSHPEIADAFDLIQQIRF